MNKLLLVILQLTLFNTCSFGQIVKTGTSGNYEYFIRLSGINSRQDVEKLQAAIIKKPGVVYFMANRYPVRYFQMIADRAITSNNFLSFLNDTPYHIEFYGIGAKGREDATLIYNKLKAPQ